MHRAASQRACRVILVRRQEQESPTCAPDRPSKILLVQVGTLSSSPIPRLACSFRFQVARPRRTRRCQRARMTEGGQGVRTPAAATERISGARWAVRQRKRKNFSKCSQTEPKGGVGASGALLGPGILLEASFFHRRSFVRGEARCCTHELQREAVRSSASARRCRP